MLLRKHLFVVAIFAGLLSVSLLCYFGVETGPEFKTIPHGLTIDIDDLGWQGGSDLSDNNGPYRIGTRAMNFKDYQQVVQVGKYLGVRLGTYWVFSELDRFNICARTEYNLPVGISDMTEYGLDWDNSKYVNDSNMLLKNLAINSHDWNYYQQTLRINVSSLNMNDEHGSLMISENG